MSEPKYIKFYFEIDHGHGPKIELGFKLPVAEATDQRVRDLYRQATDAAVESVRKALSKAPDAEPTTEKKGGGVPVAPDVKL